MKKTIAVLGLIALAIAGGITQSYAAVTVSTPTQTGSLVTGVASSTPSAAGANSYTFTGENADVLEVLSPVSIQTGQNDVQASQTVGLGVEGRHVPIEMNNYGVLRNPGDVTGITSGNIYFELGNKTGFETTQQNNSIIRSQWGGFSWGGKYGSLAVFIGRPYGGAAHLAGTDPWTTLGGGITLNVQDRLPVVAGAAIGNAIRHLGALPAAANVEYATFLANTGRTAPVANVGNLGALTPEGKIDALYGYRFGLDGDRSISVGALISIASQKTKDVDNTMAAATAINVAASTSTTPRTLVHSRRTSDLGVGLGFTFKDIWKAIPIIEVAGRMDFPRVNNYLTESVGDQNIAGTAIVATYSDTAKSAGQVSPSFNTRVTIKVTDNVSLIPFASFARQNLKLTRIATSNLFTNTVTDTYALKRNLWTLEWALNAKLGEKTLFIIANGMNINVLNSQNTRVLTAGGAAGSVATAVNVLGTIDNDTFKSNTLNIPVWIGLSHQVSKPFTLRLGCVKSVYSKTSQTFTGNDYAQVAAADTGTTKTQTITEKRFNDNSAPATVSVGIGAKITENLSADAVVQKDIFFAPQNGLTAASQNEVALTQISLKYRF